jgi:RNA polymerase sigma-70 factor, ECF subfamily
MPPEAQDRDLRGQAQTLGSATSGPDAIDDSKRSAGASSTDQCDTEPLAFVSTCSARPRREEYVGPWLPEPLVDTAALAPDSRTELA